MKTNDVERTTKQADQFDQCFAELSQEAQAYFTAQLEYIAAEMATGGGEKSAKALFTQFMRFAERKQITTATLLTR